MLYNIFHLKERVTETQDICVISKCDNIASFYLHVSAGASEDLIVFWDLSECLMGASDELSNHVHPEGSHSAAGK